MNDQESNMASGSRYPDHLNPFGSDEDDDETINNSSRSNVTYSQDQYPDHLDPFSNTDNHASSITELGSRTPTDDYDDSLNPFGEDELVGPNGSINRIGETNSDDGNPFADENSSETKQQSVAQSKQGAVREPTAIRRSPSPELLEPPKPLPRTKSLLKKEQALKKRLQEQQSIDNQANSLQSTTSSASTSSIPEPNIISHQTITAGSTFQKQKNKRLAPPVPINFKRQVSGSLDAIQEELNTIGDRLEIIDKESNICQQTLTSGNAMDELDAKTVQSKFIELVKERNSIVRRQKELMYKKRELKLDQLHSDIEYELRMIGNKQQSTRTKEDESNEKDLLKKLVEIVEEKNDIIENLNKDTSCDDRDVEEALKRLNISDTNDSPSETAANNTTSQIVSKGSQSCDKKGLTRLSKIATLLPRGDTIKMKRKRLFKKNCDSRPIER